MHSQHQARSAASLCFEWTLNSIIRRRIKGKRLFWTLVVIILFRVWELSLVRSSAILEYQNAQQQLLRPQHWHVPRNGQQEFPGSKPAIPGVTTRILSNQHGREEQHPAVPVSQQKSKQDFGVRTKLERNKRNNNVHSNFQGAMSFIEYKACCGLGHRLFRMAGAAHLARNLNFALKADWGSCGGGGGDSTNEDKGVAVWDYLFGSDRMIPHLWYQDAPFSPLPNTNISRTHVRLKLDGEIPGYSYTKNIQEQKPTGDGHIRASSRRVCFVCQTEDGEFEFLFYQHLAKRFHKRHEVQQFMDTHKFATHTVIGIHIRAGNGETGDFNTAGRQIPDTTLFLDNLAASIIHLIHKNNSNTEQLWKTHPPLIFLATDTASMVQGLELALSQQHPTTNIPIVTLPQTRPQEGRGVFFGEWKTASEEEHFLSGNATSMCLEAWDTSWMDLHILAEANVVIAARFSTFVYTMPFAMALHRHLQQKDNNNDNQRSTSLFCELGNIQRTLSCYQSYEEACCAHGAKPGYHLRWLGKAPQLDECKPSKHAFNKWLTCNSLRKSAFKEGLEKI